MGYPKAGLSGAQNPWWWGRALAGSLFLVGLAGVASAETFSGRVVGVSDGDTISVMRDGRAVKVPLEGIDCPESGQAFGQRAKQLTSSQVFGESVRVEVLDVDQYGRLVGRVFVNGRDLSLALVEAGLAWHYRRYSSERALGEAEAEARAARRGLWSLNPVPPWDWRREERGRPAATSRSEARAGCDIKGNINRKGERIYPRQAVRARFRW